MSDEIRYVRIKPYSKAQGQLARRVTVGDKLFVSGEWYQMKPANAAKIADLKQDSGALYFDVMTEEQFRATAREELALAMRAAGLQGLAFQGALPEPTVRPPKSKKQKKSDFADFGKDVSDVDLKKEGVMRDNNVVMTEDVVHKALEVDDTELENDEDRESINLDAMSPSALLELCEDSGVSIPEKYSPRILKKLLRAKGIG